MNKAFTEPHSLTWFLLCGHKYTIMRAGGGASQIGVRGGVGLRGISQPRGGLAVVLLLGGWTIFTVPSRRLGGF